MIYNYKNPYKPILETFVEIFGQCMTQNIDMSCVLKNFMVLERMNTLNHFCSVINAPFQTGSDKILTKGKIFTRLNSFRPT